jgi:vesicle-associated membrane protein 4
MSDAPYDPYVPKGGADAQAGGQSRTQALQGVSDF